MKRLLMLLIVNTAFIMPAYLFAANNDTERCTSAACFMLTSNLSSELELQGVANFRYWGFLVYSAGLYVNGQSSEQKNLLDASYIKLQIAYHRVFTAKDFKVSGREILSDNPNVNLLKYEKCLDQMDSLYQPVESGDRYSIVSSPEQGVSLYLNDDLLGSVCDQEFAKVYLSIWLSNKHGISSDFQKQLVGDKYKFTEFKECVKC